ncbi:hypothetical protein [Streptomyces mirabilis]|uniref:hypothetical protein n=2 Tax=Streptomyces mirabilis TaxID=68239 RepID=UPI003316E6C6
MFAAHQMSAPWALCSSITQEETAREWLTWASAGMEGVVFKQLNDTYRPSVWGWQKYKVRETSEAIVGAVTGHSPHAAARQARHRWSPSVRRPNHHPRPGNG